MLLCDAAEESGGKLYILGGGWSVINLPDTPVNIAVAVLIAVPWNQANEQHDIALKLVDDDGGQVEVEGQSVGAEGQFELGRPPGLKPGTDLNIPLAFRFNGISLPRGGYRFELSIDGTQVEIAPFRVQG